MLILGIDTSGRQGSIALLQAPSPAAGGPHPPSFGECGAGEGGPRKPSSLEPCSPLRTLELAPLTGGQYSEVLVPAIAALLARHGVEKHSLSLLAVASGPGSFTGLRVAIATAKALAEAFAIPVVPVSVLEAIALASPAEGRVVAALDAQRGEVFFGEYLFAERAPGIAISSQAVCSEDAANQAMRTLREDIAGFAAFVSLLASAGPPSRVSSKVPSKVPPRVLTPDESLAARLREAALDAALVARPSAEDIARIAHRKFLAGLRADVSTLDANYLRRSDAELISAPKLGIPPRLP